MTIRAQTKVIYKASLDIHVAQLDLGVKELTHAAKVEETPATENGNILLKALFTGTLPQDGLAGDEDAKGEQQIATSSKEVKHGEAEPDHIGRQGSGRMTHHMRILILHQPTQCFTEVAIKVLNKVLHIVIHSSFPLHRVARTPHQTVQQGLQQRRGTQTHLVYQVWMSCE